MSAEIAANSDPSPQQATANDAISSHTSAVSPSRSAPGHTVCQDWEDRLWQAGRYRELTAHYVQRLSAAEQARDRAGWIVAANNLACTYRAAGDQSTAAYFQLLSANAERGQLDAANSPSAVVIPGKLSATKLSATTLGNLACDALLCGKWDVAESLLWKSLLAELAIGHDAGIAADWANLAQVATLLGDHAAARERLWTALKLHRRLKDHLHMGLDVWHLALLSEEAGEWDLAARLFQRATRCFQAAGNIPLQGAAEYGVRSNLSRHRVTQFDPACN